MKKTVFLIALFLLNIILTTSLFAQKINVIFQNNSTAKGVKKFKLDIQNPDGSKSTQELSLDQTRRQTIPIEVGAKVFTANAKNLNFVEGGKELKADVPLMIVQAKDKNQTINLVEEKNASQKVIDDNIAKASSKLKLPTDTSAESFVSGNIVTTILKDKNGNPLAEFDTDKKTGAVKLITDLRKK